MSTERKIILSVVVPVHNTGTAYLEACLLPLLKIQDERLEIIVVDDGSNAETVCYLHTVFNDVERHMLIASEDEHGPNQARKKGFSVARGEYVFFVDSDDTVEVNSLLTVLGVLEENRPDILVLHTQTVACNGAVTDHFFSPELGADRVAAYMQEIAVWWMQIIKSSFLSSGCFDFYLDGSVGEDLASIVPIATHAQSIAFFDSLIYKHIMRDDGIIGAMSPTQALEILDVIQHISREESRNPTIWHKEVEWLATKHAIYYGVNNAIRCGIKSRKKIKRYYESLSAAFPEWKSNQYIWTGPLVKKLGYRLLVAGHWRVYRTLYFMRRMVLGK